MKTTILIALVSLSIPAFAEPVAKDAHTNIALQGHDPVGFFTEIQALSGTLEIQTEHGGAVYFFASEEIKTAFLADPEKHLPAYGGNCAYGAAIGVLLPVDISTWEIVDGKLVLQYNAEIAQLFKEDSEGNFKKANAFWASQK